MDLKRLERAGLVICLLTCIVSVPLACNNHTLKSDATAYRLQTAYSRACKSELSRLSSVQDIDELVLFLSPYLKNEKLYNLSTIVLAPGTSIAKGTAAFVVQSSHALLVSQDFALTLSSPADDSYFNYGESVEIKGSVLNIEDQLVDLKLTINGTDMGKLACLNGQFDVIASSLKVGSNHLTIAAQSSQGKRIEVARNFSIFTNYPPVVLMPDLIDGTELTPNQPLEVEVSVADPNPEDKLQAVVLEVNSKPIATNTTSPCRFTVTNLIAGNNTIRATATDWHGAKGVSYKASVLVLPATQKSVK